MKTNVIVATKETKIQEVMHIFKEKRIRHMPVVDELGHVIGIVSGRDIKDASPSIFHADEHLEDLLKPISSIMKEDVITAHPLDFVEEVASLFYEHHIGCLPITEDGKLVGIITETDVLHTLVVLMGANQPSSHIQVKVENVTGRLADVSAIFKEKKVNITSVLVVPCKDPNYKVLAFRIQTIDPRGIISAIEKEGYEVVWPKVPGPHL